ncbi:MAG: hypothetical protein AAB401_09340, partial [Acidobacteriota bacterium]
MTMNYLKRFLPVLILALCCMAAVPARAEQEGVVRYGVSQTALQNDFVDGYGDNGYLPVRLTGYQES